jgi:hypothetical protein
MERWKTLYRALELPRNCPAEQWNRTPERVDSKSYPANPRKQSHGVAGRLPVMHGTFRMSGGASMKWGLER